MNTAGNLCEFSSDSEVKIFVLFNFLKVSLICKILCYCWLVFHSLLDISVRNFLIILVYVYFDFHLC
jgi:hypothetical protein